MSLLLIRQKHYKAKLLHWDQNLCLNKSEDGKYLELDLAFALISIGLTYDPFWVFVSDGYERVRPLLSHSDLLPQT